MEIYGKGRWNSIYCIPDSAGSTINNGLVGYWPFNGNANDESGNGNNGIVNGATLTTDRFGNVGKAYNFDGINSCIEILNSASLQISNSITLISWVKINNSNIPSMSVNAKGEQGSYWNYGLNIGGGVSGNYPSFLFTNYSVGVQKK